MKKIKIVTGLLLAFSLFSCRKYLDEKPDKKLVIPATLEDCQAILDNNTYINSFQNNGIGELSADNFYLTTSVWSALNMQSYKEIYVWGEEIFYDNPPGSNDWSNLYGIVYKSNVVLEVVDKINQTPQNISAWNNVKGSALFLRAEAFSVLARNFAKPYDNSSSDLGIPLRLSSDFNIPSERSSVKDTYNRIIQDIQASLSFLPVTSAHVMRPSKTAAYGLLARVNLSMREYSKAALYADSSLQLYNTLIDYNSSSATATYPFNRFNPETIYLAQGSSTTLANTRAKIDSVLYLSYTANDLRKSLYFRSNGDGTYGFKGNYTGSSSLFVGISTDEMYLTKAESLCRISSYTDALSILNSLMIKRWKQGTFIPFVASSQTAALNIILLERRKELLMRDLRWIDIKRLNKENAGIGLKRILNNQVFELPAGDNRFALPLPASVVKLTGMLQNPR